MNNVLRTLGVILVLAPLTMSEPTYSVTAPNTIRENSPYKVVVNHHLADNLNGRCVNDSSRLPLHVTVRILGSSYSSTNNTVVVKREANVPISTSKTLTLPIPTLDKDRYILEVNGSGAVTFNHATQLSYRKKQISIFIQMDKSIYQLGQLVKYRVVVTNSNLLPESHDPIEVFIIDADNNRIRQWNDVVPHNGVFQGTFQLSSQPVLGTWTLSATVKGTTVQNTFTVGEYVLPRYEASVEVPGIITTKDNSFVIKISARYTFGGPVTGSFRLVVARGFCTYISSCGDTRLVVNGQISGTTQVPVIITDLYTSAYIYSGYVTAFVEVTESSTEISTNASTSFQIYDDSQYLSVILDRTFKPKSTLPITVALRQQNGLPVTNVNGIFNVSYVFGSSSVYNPPPPTIVILRPSSRGTATFNLVPSVDVNFLTVQATYNTLSANGYSSLAPSATNKYLTITVTTKNPTVDCSLKVNVETTFEMSHSYVYQVVGRGSILIAKTVKLQRPTTSTSFSVTVTREMAPHARIVVYYTTGCGELIGDSIDITVAGLIQTPVTLRFSNTTVEPGQNLTLEITSRPNSDVALSGVDRSVLLLSAANDITLAEIYSEVLSYDIGNNNNDYSVAGVIRRPNYNGGSLDEIFSFAGLLFFSNRFRSTPTQIVCPTPIFDAITTDFNGETILELAEVTATDSGVTAEEAGELVQPDRIRNFFPESWIWSTSRTGPDGKAEVHLTAPDTLTTYVTTAFAVSQTYGLGVADKPANVTIFRDFFIVVNLPFSVVRTEKISIQVQIFNNIDVKLDPVIVTLNNTEGEYIILEGNGDESPTSLSKNIVVAANQVEVVTFAIQPLKVGYIKLLFKAVSPYAGDAIESPLLVRAEGSPQYFSRSVLIDLRTASSFATSIAVTVPEDAVPGSEYIEVQITGNIMTSFAANIANLIQLPYGCGEQNMLNFAPDVVVLDYLNISNLLTEEVQTQLINYLETGYQTELRYKRNDGSFSAFGQSDPAGSTWLTAFVLKSFEQAKSYIIIDPNVISAAQRFIVSKQRPNGEFFEDGRVIHKAMQGGGASAGQALTAYVLISLQQDVNPNDNSTTTAIRTGVRYLEFNYNSTNSTYDACITAYALHLSNSSEKDRAFAIIDTLKTVQGEFVFWHVDVPKPSGSDWYYQTPASYDVEATGYCLLTYIYRKESTNNILPAVRWLVASRSAFGGYSSSQDTVIGIEALATFARSIATTSTFALQINVSYLSNTSTFDLNKGNELVLQKLQLPKEVTTVQIQASGNGVGIAQVAWNYNIVKNVSRDRSFRVTPTISRPTNRSYNLDICQSYLLDGRTNMVITHIDTLSGYIWNQDACSTTNSLVELSRVEFSQSGTAVDFYFTEIPKTPNQVCVSCSAIQSYEVTDLQRALITTYDYYETAKRTEVFYTI